MFPAKVGDPIASAPPWTLTLVGLATIISFILGIVIFAMIGPALTQDPRAYDNAPMQAPGGGHWSLVTRAAGFALTSDKFLPGFLVPAQQRTWVERKRWRMWPQLRRENSFKVEWRLLTFAVLGLRGPTKRLKVESVRLKNRKVGSR